jgi:hypothetical protein
MEVVYQSLMELQNRLPNIYEVHYGKSTIRVIAYTEQYTSIGVDIFVMDIEECLRKNKIKYERKYIKFYSEYPSFLIYKDNENIGIVVINYGIK